MNFRKLLTYLTVGTTAVIPFAGAQNPTILQGSYISNVFGQSNFILNPNAQTNVANVTTVTATVTRSTTTPLVATSEFNVAIGTANGTATWATRAFDAGMKGQNCEARFSYRGFAATSKVHIKQGANTVASLNLTPATDPRIASINFPCGDLSTATTFVVTDTAILAGTNEIGAIYTGLATNMANVAQAELVGTWTMSGASNCEFTTSATSYGSPSNFSTADADCNNPVVTGSLISKGKVLGFDVPVKAGEYLITVQAPMRRITANAGAYFILKDGTTNTGEQLIYTNSAAELFGIYQISFNVSYTASATKTIYLDGKVDNASASAGVTNIPGRGVTFSVYRFPTSSELVVTPERQNTFAGLKGTASSATNSVSTNAWTKLTSTTTLTRTNYGKAKAETNNDYSITIDNMPVGSYYIAATGVFYSQSSISGNATECWFGIADTATGGAQISGITAIAIGDATNTTQAISNGTLGGVYTVSAVASKTFFLQAYRSSGSGTCQAFSRTDTPLTITVIPLDQPSNSALFVEGPVKASATGAAIPAGYVGETIASAATNVTATPSGSWIFASSGVTLQPGVYLISHWCTWPYPAANQAVSCMVSTNNTTGGAIWGDQTWNQVTWVNGTFPHAITIAPKVIRITTATLLYFGAVQLGVASNTATHRMEALRIN
jgi:hypothetical protein